MKLWVIQRHAVLRQRKPKSPDRRRQGQHRWFLQRGRWGLGGWVVYLSRWRCAGRFWGWVVLGLLGLILTVGIPLRLMPMPGASGVMAADPSQVQGQRLPPTTAPHVSEGQALLQAGLSDYQAERFAAAAQTWQQALRAFGAQVDPLHQGLTQRYLSLAYQHLGDWDAATAAIDHSLTLLQPLAPSTDPQTYAEVMAKVWNTQGRLHWAQGQSNAALSSWEQATRQYAQAGHTEGIVRTKINQAQALQALGLNRQAEALLQQVNVSLQETPNRALKAAGLQTLGLALRRVGHLDQARDRLQVSLAEATAPTHQSLALLELGNTERALGQRAIALGQSKAANAHHEAALRFYQQAAITAPNRQLQPLLNQLSLRVELGQWREARLLQASLLPQLDRLPASRAGVEAHLNFAQSLTCFKQVAAFNDSACERGTPRAQRPSAAVPPPRTTPTWDTITGILSTAAQQAHDLADPIAEAYALGQLGGVYELRQQWSMAQDLTQQALLRLEGVQAPDIRYRWEWQLGRLQAQQGNRDQAIMAYGTAVESLQSVRSDLLTINPEVQFSFRDRVEPVYRGLVDLLLQPDANPDQVQANLTQAIANIDRLQLAELENFLGCNLGPTAQLNQDVDALDPNAAFLYPIVMDDRLAVIFKLPGQPLGHYSTPVSRGEVEQTVKTLQRALVRRNAGRVVQAGQTVYQWLLAPLEPQLATHQDIETLVFVLDSELRNIPLAALRDAQTGEYLVQKPYALALLPSSQLFDLQPPSGPFQVLGAGISDRLQVDDRNFAPLDITTELQHIQRTAPSTILLNAAFTQDNLQRTLRSGQFSVLHLATHGNFSSNPDETFVLAHSAEAKVGDLLNPNDLHGLLRSTERGTASPIELLVLSACQTATGDNRAVLGLAGLAVRSGARSTLATLWQVSDASTVALMEQFYQRLDQAGTTKAAALHQAQQALLQNPRSQNPYYWAPYVLVGNWR